MEIQADEGNQLSTKRGGKLVVYATVQYGRGEHDRIHYDRTNWDTAAQ